MGKTLLKTVASLSVLAVLFYFIDTDAILTRLRNADIGWLAVALVALTALTFLMAWRWQMSAHALNLSLRYGRAVREYYIAQLLNLVLPGGMAGDAARAVRIRQDGDLLRAAQSVMMERLIGQSTLFGLMFVSFSVAMFLPGGLNWPLWTWWFLVLGVAIAVGGVVYARRQSSAARFLALSFTVMCRPRQLLLSALIALLIVFSFYACARATGTMLPWASVFTLIPLILTAMLIPLSVGGWGWREGAAAALFPLAGAIPSAGVAASITYGAMMLVAAIPATFLMFFQKTQAAPAMGPAADESAVNRDV